jgi:hypothetical protein
MANCMQQSCCHAVMQSCSHAVSRHQLLHMPMHCLCTGQWHVAQGAWVHPCTLHSVMVVDSNRPAHKASL